MTNLSKLKKNILALFLAVLLLFSGQFFLPTNFACVKAETLSYTNVVDDLRKDDSFDIYSYPVCSLDNYKKVNNDEDETNDIEAISIIQIGESDSGDLFIYTYQPINLDLDLIASSILMSTEENTSMNTLSFSSDDSKEFLKYSLKCVSSDNIFKKYLVEGFKIKSEIFRYYNIVEIERPFNSEIDEKISDETITNFVSHKVAQSWCCYYGDDGLKYERGDLEVVQITPTLTDFVYSEGGLTWGSLIGVDSGSTANYIAFNIDNYKADCILDASIDFNTRKITKTTVTTSNFGELLFNLIVGRDSTQYYYSYPDGENFKSLDKPFYLSSADKVTSSGSGLWAKKYTWNCIMSASDFIQSSKDQKVSFTDSVEETLSNSEWVFVFHVADASIFPYSSGDYHYTSFTRTEVAKVDVLRLKFMVGKETYNLGVVSDTTSDDGKPGGIGSGLDLKLETIYDVIKKVIALIAVVLICVVLGPFISPVLNVVFQFLGKIFGWLFRNIWKILTFPFRLFKRKSIPKARKRKR